MGFFSRWRIHKTVSDRDTVDVSEKAGVRSLHFGDETVQSAMRLSRPNDLELGYTRSMMGCLLFRSDSREFLMIGLGGGSLAKFVYHRLPQARTTVVEINPRVISIARSYFYVPEDDERLRVKLGDGLEHVRDAPAGSVDILMVDGFDAGCQVESLASESFYQLCAEALSAEGVLVVNLWGSDRNFDVYLKRIESVFEGRVVILPARTRGNVIAFAFRTSPGPLRWVDLKDRARHLEAVLGLEFNDFVDGLKSSNPHSHGLLHIASRGA